MSRLVRAELVKLRTVWSTWVILIIAVAFTLPGGLLVGFAPHNNGIRHLIFPTEGTRAWFDLVLSTMDVVLDLALILGILMVTGEYRHKTVTPTFLYEPRRGRVAAAKLFAAAGAAVAVAVAGGVAGLLLGFGLVASGHGNIAEMLGAFGHVFPGVLFATVLFGVYGLGLGAIMKNQVAALVTGLGASAVIEPLVASTVPAVGRWLPGEAAQALESVTAHAIKGGHGGGFLTGITGLKLVTWWEGALALLIYGLVFVIAGSLTTLRSDVT